MKLRSFLPRRPGANEVPLLPAISPDSHSALRGAFVGRSRREERLERLLTPTELDLVQHRQF
ncbi:hypothetical protein GCM10011591_24110 [Nocardia camponoti]|uniref:Uncharacterized protein n=1 Tax=Nocardia camponoti TaxID=1616106 RepID=A0A917QI73_9NOCA|nr:hypothetical protein GCM10011591_24110 [Nocardia camponoti]